METIEKKNRIKIKKKREYEINLPFLIQNNDKIVKSTRYLLTRLNQQ